MAEDGTYEYDIDEIADKSVPCLRVLHDIHKVLYSGLVVGKDDRFDQGFKAGF